MRYPKMVRVRQEFDRTRVNDVVTTVREALESLDLGRTIRPGHTVALTAGSRGIANIPLILQTVVCFLQKLGAKPFLVPSMGSHGGATPEGQRKVLESYGITEAAVGAPIRATMEVLPLGLTPEGIPVVLDRFAAEADHIGVVGRVKPHTGFHGPIESGISKMMAIGLGKHAGALAYHRVLLDLPFDLVVRSISRVIRQSAPVVFGLALVENAFEETACVEALRPENFEEAEERLLIRAKRWLGHLPLRDADLLIVDEIGKDISGSGMDTNVVGRKRAFRLASPQWTDSGNASSTTVTGGGQTQTDTNSHSDKESQPRIRHIFARGLSEKTHGNATGIGLADFTTTRLIRAMNYPATVLNCLTAGYPEGANLPVHFDTDREVIDAALSIIGRRLPEEARVLRIHNTLDLENVIVSEPCLPLLEKNAHVKVDEHAVPLEFDGNGNLLTFGIG